MNEIIRVRTIYCCSLVARPHVHLQLSRARFVVGSGSGACSSTTTATPHEYFDRTGTERLRALVRVEFTFGIAGGLRPTRSDFPESSHLAKNGSKLALTSIAPGDRLLDLPQYAKVDAARN